MLHGSPVPVRHTASTCYLFWVTGIYHTNVLFLVFSANKSVYETVLAFSNQLCFTQLRVVRHSASLRQKGFAAFIITIFPNICFENRGKEACYSLYILIYTQCNSMTILSIYMCTQHGSIFGLRYE